jgi:4-amino-4-deoxy-L-arabinose transferase-like glycosyltransferase
VAWLFPSSVLPLQVVSVVFTLATIYVFHRYARSRVSAAMAAVVTMVFALNPQVVAASSWVMSEAVFVFFVWLSLLLVERLVADEVPALRQVLFALLAVAMMPLTRYFGLPLMAAALGYVLLRRRDRKATVFLACVLFVVLAISLAFGATALWERYSSVVSGLLGRISGGVDLAGRQTASNASLGFWQAMGRNVRHLLLHALPSSIVPLFDGPRVIRLFASLGLGTVPPAIQLLVSSLVLVGFIHSALRGITALDIYAVCYVGSASHGRQMAGEWLLLALRFPYDRLCPALLS